MLVRHVIQCVDQHVMLLLVCVGSHIDLVLRLLLDDVDKLRHVLLWWLWLEDSRRLWWNDNRSRCFNALTLVASWPSWSAFTALSLRSRNRYEAVRH